MHTLSKRANPIGRTLLRPTPDRARPARNHRLQHPSSDRQATRSILSAITDRCRGRPTAPLGRTHERTRTDPRRASADRHRSPLRSAVRGVRPRWFGRSVRDGRDTDDRGADCADRRIGARLPLDLARRFRSFCASCEFVILEVLEQSQRRLSLSVRYRWEWTPLRPGHGHALVISSDRSVRIRCRCRRSLAMLPQLRPLGPDAFMTHHRLLPLRVWS